MYNAIGLTTPRGSGTNGYVQRNFAGLPNLKRNINEENTKLDAFLRQPNIEILDHEKKRKIEIKCMEFEQKLEDQGYAEAEITKRVEDYRQSLMPKQIPVAENFVLPVDEHGRVCVKETHEIAAAQQRKNEKLRDAFGISEYFVEGSSLDPARRAREAAARAAAIAVHQKTYTMVKTPSTTPSPPPSVKNSHTLNEKRRRSSSSAVEEDVKKKKKKLKNNRAKSESSDDQEEPSSATNEGKRAKYSSKSKPKKQKKREILLPADDPESSDEEVKKQSKKKKKKSKHTKSQDSFDSGSTDSELELIKKCSKSQMKVYTEKGGKKPSSKLSSSVNKRIVVEEEEDFYNRKKERDTIKSRSDKRSKRTSSTESSEAEKYRRQNNRSVKQSKIVSRRRSASSATESYEKSMRDNRSKRDEYRQDKKFHKKPIYHDDDDESSDNLKNTKPEKSIRRKDRKKSSGRKLSDDESSDSFEKTKKSKKRFYNSDDSDKNDKPKKKSKYENHRSWESETPPPTKRKITKRRSSSEEEEEKVSRNKRKTLKEKDHKRLRPESDSDGLEIKKAPKDKKKDNYKYENDSEDDDDYYRRQEAVGRKSRKEKFVEDAKTSREHNGDKTVKNKPPRFVRSESSGKEYRKKAGRGEKSREKRSKTPEKTRSGWKITRDDEDILCLKRAQREKSMSDEIIRLKSDKKSDKDKLKRKNRDKSPEEIKDKKSLQKRVVKRCYTSSSTSSSSSTMSSSSSSSDDDDKKRRKSKLPKKLKVDIDEILSMPLEKDILPSKNIRKNKPDVVETNLKMNKKSSSTVAASPAPFDDASIYNMIEKGTSMSPMTKKEFSKKEIAKMDERKNRILSRMKFLRKPTEDSKNTTTSEDFAKLSEKEKNKLPDLDVAEDLKENRRQRNSSASSARSLSYSPLRKHPERYADLLAKVAADERKKNLHRRQSPGKKESSTNLKMTSSSSSIKISLKDSAPAASTSEKGASSDKVFPSAEEMVKPVSLDEIELPKNSSNVVKPNKIVPISTGYNTVIASEYSTDSEISSSKKGTKTLPSVVATVVSSQVKPVIAMEVGQSGSSPLPLAKEAVQKLSASPELKNRSFRNRRSSSSSSSSSSYRRRSRTDSSSSSSSSSPPSSRSRSGRRRRDRSVSTYYSGSGGRRSKSTSSGYRSRRRYGRHSRHRSYSRSRSYSSRRRHSRTRSSSIDDHRRRYRSRSRSYSYSSSSKSRSRSTSIPHRRGSPNFLQPRRITSARKPAIKYTRQDPLPVGRSSSSSSGNSSYSLRFSITSPFLSRSPISPIRSPNNKSTP